MKKIYVQKKMFILMNLISLFFVLVGLYGGFTTDKSMFYLMFISLGLSILSLLFLIDKILYNDEEIRFSFIYRKATYRYKDIKKVFIKYDLISRMKEIFKIKKKTDEKKNE